MRVLTSLGLGIPVRHVKWYFHPIRWLKQWWHLRSWRGREIVINGQTHKIRKVLSSTQIEIEP
jgi:hypothetical protein